MDEKHTIKGKQTQENRSGALHRHYKRGAAVAAVAAPHFVVSYWSFRNCEFSHWVIIFFWGYHFDSPSRGPYVWE